jgi:hypothetical protein
MGRYIEDETKFMSRYEHLRQTFYWVDGQSVKCVTITLSKVQC